MRQPILQFDRVSKTYQDDGRVTRAALLDVSFTLAAGATLSIVGRSGSGKSTLLHLAAGIDVPSAGRVLLAGQDLSSIGERQRTLLRREHVGLVFQFFYLLPHLSLLENIALPEWIAGRTMPQVKSRVLELLERVGLADRANDTVQKLSGGEMQRVAICRALIRRPALLLADEPTGNLDDENSRVVMELLLQLAREEESTLVYVTHSAELASLAGATWHLHSGQLDRGTAG
jgi:ABC-type lipoprotein export system ATPase subunit